MTFAPANAMQFLAWPYATERTCLRGFGSIPRCSQRGDHAASSDSDLLVSWDRGRDLFDHVELKEDLQDLLGVKVDVITEKTLPWYIRDRVLAPGQALVTQSSPPDDGLYLQHIPAIRRRKSRPARFRAS